MSQKVRIAIGIVLLLVAVGVVLGIDAWRRTNAQSQQVGEVVLAPGSVPIYLDGQLVAGFQPTDLEQLTKVSFVDAEQGKTQEGWLLRDVILLHVQRKRLKAASLITVTSSSRNKSAKVTWGQADEPANWVMFDLSGRGTLKLVSVLEGLKTRDQWVQDVDQVEITSP